MSELNKYSPSLVQLNVSDTNENRQDIPWVNPILQKHFITFPKRSLKILI